MEMRAFVGSILGNSFDVFLGLALEKYIGT